MEIITNHKISISYSLFYKLYFIKTKITSEVVDGSLVLSEDLSIKLRATLAILVNNRDN